MSQLIPPPTDTSWLETEAVGARFLWWGRKRRSRRVRDVDHLCEVMHDAYEAAAAGNGWETQKASRKPWADVPEPNKATMRAAVRALLNELEN